MPQRGREQLAERPVTRGRGGRDNHDVTRLALLHRGVNHQVVAGPADDGDGRAADSRPWVDRAQARPEVARAADGLVHGGDTELGQPGDLRRIGSRAAGDDDVPHVSILVTSGYNLM